MKNIYERAGFFRVLRRRTLTLSALLFFMISCGADAASVTDYAEEELFADALINLSSRLSFLEELQLEPHPLYSRRTLEYLRSIYAPDDPENAWVFEEDSEDGSTEKAWAGSWVVPGEDSEDRNTISEDRDTVSADRNTSAVTVLDDTMIRWGAKHLEDGTGSLYIRQFSGDYDAVCVKIPEKVGTMKITQIEAGCFSSMKEILVRAVLPETIHRIGEGAFQGCKELKEINIPASLAEVGEKAFAGTDLRYFYVPKENPVLESRDGVLYERSGAKLLAYPAGNRREEYAIPEGTAAVECGAFSGNPYLAKCTLPASLKELPAGVFSDSRIRYLDAVEQNNTFKSVDGVLFRKISNGDAKVLAFYPPGKKQERYVVNRSTRSIEDEAFCSNPYLRQVFLPEGLVRIGRAAFAGCISLESISLPESLADLENYAFSGCVSLTGVRLPSHLDVLDADVFYGCSSLESPEISGETAVIEEASDTGKGAGILQSIANMIKEGNY